MAYSIAEEDNILSVFEKIGNEPCLESAAYNEVRNPKAIKPVVGNTAMFEGQEVDFSRWTSGNPKPLTEAKKAGGVIADSEKVGKAKTAQNPKLTNSKSPSVTDTKAKSTGAKKVTENDTVTDKKEKGQVTKVVSDNATHEATKEPTPKSGSFEKAANAAASSQRSKADSNKKFSEESKRQKKIELFRNFVKGLAIDAATTDAANKVLAKFDKISKYIGK